MPNHHAYIDNDGENQICECSNDTLVNDWYSADQTGRIDPIRQGSTDPEECTVCSSCGAIFRNRDLFALVEGDVAHAIAHHDPNAPEFRADLTTYELAIYGAPGTDSKD